MPRGGRRNGTPGRSYGQSTDLNQRQFDANVKASRTQFDTSRTGFGFDVYGLGAADTAFRGQADFGLKTNFANADLGLEGAISGADFSFQQSQINTEGAQYKIDQTSNLTMNFLQGISQVALWASNPAVGAAAKGFGDWWGSNFNSTPSSSGGYDADTLWNAQQNYSNGAPFN